VTFTQLAERVRETIGQDHRYAHSIRVARCAERLARIPGADTRTARIAGMLHDLARLFSSERLLKECSTRGMPIGPYERAHPIVLHAPLSAPLAREAFDVRDPEILSAISKHTLGAPNMSLLDRIVFLADSLEPGRQFSDRAALAALAGRDVARAMQGTIQQSIRYLQEKGLSLAPQTAAALQEATTGRTS